MSFHIFDIATITNATFLQKASNTLIENLITDSRKLLLPHSSLFFSLHGDIRNGNNFIDALYNNGLKNFVVDNTFSEANIAKYPDATFLQVDDVTTALQKLASYHRHQYNFPIIGITGSNGKTIVKEWLYQLLAPNFNLVRNPKSYNSQIGVPLSVWKINEKHNLGIFEAGISLPNEMQNLQKIIDPEIGIVTFIGSAHNQGFANTSEKINEKLILFKNSKQLIYCADDLELNSHINTFIVSENKALKIFTWSKKNNANLFIQKIETYNKTTHIFCKYQNKQFNFSIPFTDEASIHNAITCCCTMLLLNIDINSIAEKMLQLKPLAMRLELKQGINNCSIINDSYSTDLQSLGISLDFLAQQNQHAKHTVILSDVLQAGDNTEDLYNQIATALSGKNINRLIGIGNDISKYRNAFSNISNTIFYPDTNSFLQSFTSLNFNNEVVLLKGARVFLFEKISALLEQKVHETKLEINLNAIRNNLKVYRNLLQPSTKIMAMVKAFSYGSGGYEIANVLQHSAIDYLAVAYADEGVDLRRAGITLPIMVMNTEFSGFDNLVKYNLEPEIYSFNILHSFNNYIATNNISSFPIHLKIDTGMHRLGFDENDIENLCHLLHTYNALKVVSVFSHLAGSDAKDYDEFTTQQATSLKTVSKKIEASIGYSFINHIANTSAINRFPHLQLDMVRLGIGMYGIDVSPNIQNQLLPVATLKTTISQIKKLQKGDTIGYSRKGIINHQTTTATVRIGYADGYPRNLSNGIGYMHINGIAAPVIGNICMDMTMLDVTGIDVNEGDEVIVFGETPTVSSLAEWANTIPYEILTNISQRVKRIYFEE